ncbi:MAG: PAS-domain containing protein [Maricaulis sp.]|uniref:PAS domain-containing sensor histidine kinase n=1 Tax=Maricaulis sp. TaxID=1486257 RepID=UPI001B11B1E5|nr:PAS domain-containing sensor histidine kinase [Maricaulis sp.]MBO6728803.1 PAS-domain containing protein [Maricaulis sp.]MBO6847629.1 PAS-domain containing protein [Maricaulis sp.]MBO6876944.1 PAS-domain containing protein [Maricaulis sp.]MDM7985117.1 PAS-domain containing protein [Maricaulis sp.]
MTGQTFQIATLLVTFGSMAFALVVGVWAFRKTAGSRASQAIWRRRTAELEDRIARADSVFGAHPGLVVVWDEPPFDEADTGWGQPKIFGSSVALASLLRFAEATDGPDPAAILMEGLADYEARSSSGEETTLRRRFQDLMQQGRPFSLTIIGPSGRFLEVDGRAAGTQLVVWLSDSTIRGLEESGARGRIEEARRVVSKDPVAFLDMLGRAPFPAWRINASGRIEWANPIYIKAVDGDVLDDVLQNQTYLDAGMKEQTTKAIEASAPVSEIRIVVVNGRRRAMEFLIFPVSGGAAGIAIDQTASEEAKADLKRFRRAHDETLNHMAEAVVVFDRSKRMSFHNTAFTKLFKLDDAWLTERPGHAQMLDRMREKRLLPEQADYSAWKADELARYDDSPNDESPDELWPLPDGRTLRVARQRHPLGGVMLIFEDKTDELALKARYNTLINVQRATLDKLHEAVAVFGADGRLQLNNNAFEELWGFRAGELEGQPFFDDVAETCAALFADDRVWTDIKGRVTDPSPQARKQVTGEMRRSDERVLTYLTRPLPDGATLICWDDVTDSRRIEEALRERAEALEASERIKTEFVEHVSYQLRTPLTTIGGYADMLAHGFAGELTDRQKEPMSAIQSASTHLAKLIDDILDVAAIDAGKLELDLGDVPIGEVISEAAELVAARADHESIKLDVKIDKEAGLLRADRNRLKQVSMNLLSNALRHVDPGGHVEIGARRADDQITLWVKDDGEGISPEQQAKVFERFSRGERGGAGLGLALVKEIAQLHGGWVELVSEPGKGTEVSCHLPLEPRGKGVPPELALMGSTTAKLSETV